MESQAAFLLKESHKQIPITLFRVLDPFFLYHSLERHG